MSSREGNDKRRKAAEVAAQETRLRPLVEMLPQLFAEFKARVERFLTMRKAENKGK